MHVPKGKNYPAGHSVQMYIQRSHPNLCIRACCVSPLEQLIICRDESRQHFVFLSQAKNKKV